MIPGSFEDLSRLVQGDKKELLVSALALDGLFVFCLTICAFVVAGTANAGFNVVLTAFLNIAYIGGTYFVLKNSKSPLAYGFLIGVSAALAILNFMTAVYWGQLSHCDTSVSGVAQYTCTRPSAYGAVSAFSVLVFLLQSGFTFLLITWRSDFIGEEGAYESVSTSSAPYDIKTGNSFVVPTPATSADL